MVFCFFDHHNKWTWRMCEKRKIKQPNLEVFFQLHSTFTFSSWVKMKKAIFTIIIHYHRLLIDLLKFKGNFFCLIFLLKFFWRKGKKKIHIINSNGFTHWWRFICERGEIWKHSNVFAPIRILFTLEKKSDWLDCDDVNDFFHFNVFYSFPSQKIKLIINYQYH